MTIPDLILLRAEWGARGESPDSIVDRVGSILGSFSAVKGPLSAPFWSNSPKLISGNGSALAQLVENGYETKADTGDVLRESGTSLSLMQDPEGPSSRARVLISMRMGNEHGSRRKASNSVVVTFGSRLVGFGGDAIGSDEVLSHGLRLVKEFVRILAPDAVSLDSRELLDAQVVRGTAYPVIGFVTWLGDNVVAGDLSGVRTAYCEHIANGTLLSVDLTSDQLIEDGLALVDQVFGAGLLRPLPAVQGE